MLFFLKYAPGPPGPLLQNVNQFLHTEPIASIVYALYWIIFFIIATPLVTAFLSIQLVVHLVLWLTGNTGADACNPKKWAEEKEMAVFVTGCDTGFGTEIAFRAAHEGFVVFAACLKEESKKQFDLEPRIHPLVMDVTKDDSVAAAVKEFTMWVNNEESPKKGEGLVPRVLHAVINNAGIGVGGEVDWLDMSMFHNVMEVNYMGMVRVCKGFLPILKEQAIKRTHTDSRILNIVSMAGIISGPGLAPYTASKHAAVAFTAGLRMELKCFGIQVSSVNPSFHGTVLVDSMGDVLHKVWDSLPESKREEYGQEYFERYHLINSQGPRLSTWKLEVVVEQVLGCLEARRVPAELAIGSDARFVFSGMRMLPAWLRDLAMLTSMPRLPPAAMQKEQH